MKHVQNKGKYRDTGNRIKGQAHTELTPLKPLQLSPAGQQLLDGSDMLLLLEARKQLQVLLRLEEGLALGHLLLDGAASSHDCVDDSARFGEVQSGNIVKLAELEDCCCFFITGWWALWT